MHHDTPPPGWTRRSVDEYQPAGTPPAGAIWYTDSATGASTAHSFDEAEAIRRAWQLRERLARMLAEVQKRRAA